MVFYILVSYLFEVFYVIQTMFEQCLAHDAACSCLLSLSELQLLKTFSPLIPRPGPASGHSCLVRAGRIVQARITRRPGFLDLVKQSIQICNRNTFQDTYRRDDINTSMTGSLSGEKFITQIK